MFSSGSDHVLTISFYLERATDYLLQSVTTVFTSAQLKQFDLNHCHGMCQMFKKNAYVNYYVLQYLHSVTYL